MIKIERFSEIISVNYQIANLFVATLFCFSHDI